LSNLAHKAKLENRNSKLETRNLITGIRNSKLETRNSKLASYASNCAHRISRIAEKSKIRFRNPKFASYSSSFKFRVSSFEFPVSSFRFPVSIFDFPVSIFEFRISFLLAAALLLLPAILCAQVETVESPPTAAVWSAQGHVEGHLTLKYSSDGAFSPDSALLAVVADDKVLVMNLRANDVKKVLKLRLPDIQDLEIHSANFLSPHQLFLLANGVFHAKGQRPAPTPLLAFLWDVEGDNLEGKVRSVGASGGFSPARYFPMIGYLALYKDSNFDLWNPRTGQGGRITLPDLTHIPNLYEPSPDGHWMLLGQIQTTSSADPTVVDWNTHKFVDSLRGHEGTVLSMAFSRDAKKVVTACEDGKVRVFSAGDWKLLEMLVGHHGPVHRAEFSPNGKWIASAGEDHTMRVWSADDGALLQTLQESRQPLLDVAFSSDSRFIAASSEGLVLTWQRQGGD
jgi:WD40 repeat protein